MFNTLHVVVVRRLLRTPCSAMLKLKLNLIPRTCSSVGANIVVLTIAIMAPAWSDNRVARCMHCEAEALSSCFQRRLPLHVPLLAFASLPALLQ